MVDDGSIRISRQDRITLTFAIGTAVQHEETAIRQLVNGGPMTSDLRATIRERRQLLHRYSELRSQLGMDQNSTGGRIAQAHATNIRRGPNHHGL